MKTILSILKKPIYVCIGFFVFLISFIVFSIIPHLTELGEIRALDNSISADGSVFWATIRSFLGHTFEPTLIPTLIISVLFGLIIVLLVYYYKHNGRTLIKTSGSGTLGVVLGVLGVGCSACGTLALTAVLGSVGLGWLVALLPFAGAEFLYLGIAAMVFSIWQLVALINKPFVCE